MGSWIMRGLRIGDWPLSTNLKTAGDRRRLIFWANARGHTIITDLTQRVDVLVASEGSDFNSSIFAQKEVPIIFDLVDAYLSPLNQYDDLARGLAKKLSGQISGSIKPFSHHVRNFCMNSDAVICSSTEQEVVINQFNSNVHVILDSHHEIQFIEPILARSLPLEAVRVLWEGQPATLRGLGQISATLFQLSKMKDIQFDFVTDENYSQYMGKYFKKSTAALLEKIVNPIFDRIKIIPWSPGNLVSSAKSSSIAMIPLDLSIPMQLLKPENRLLIMWRLGLPCLTSPSPAYARVANQAGASVVCENSDAWLENFLRLLNDPVFAHAEILRGQDYLRKNHNETVLLNKWDEAIESAIG